MDDRKNSDRKVNSYVSTTIPEKKQNSGGGWVASALQTAMHKIRNITASINGNAKPGLLGKRYPNPVHTQAPAPAPAPGDSHRSSSILVRFRRMNGSDFSDFSDFSDCDVCDRSNGSTKGKNKNKNKNNSKNNKKGPSVDTNDTTLEDDVVVTQQPEATQKNGWRQKKDKSVLSRGDLLAPVPSVFIVRAATLMTQCCAPHEQLRYTLQRELGRGTFGTVYMAWDHLTRQSVAIKVCLTWGDPRTLADIWKELELLSMLRRHPHENTVEFHRLLQPHPSYATLGAQVPPAIYYSMHLYPMGTLHDLLVRRNEWKRRQAVQQGQGQGHSVGVASVRRIIAELLNGLAHMHDTLHVVHRDLGPCNIMVSAPSNTDKSTLGHGECDGFAVHVADFGSCKPAFPDVFLRRDDTSGLTSRSSSWASAMSDADPDPRYTRGSPEKKATDSCSSGDAVTQRARCSVYYVSRFYRPPEMWCDVNSEHPSMLYGSFTDRGDMWSVGCLMAELLVIGEPLFKCDNLDSFCRIACEYLGPPGSEVLSRFRSPALRQRLLKAHVREVTQPGSTLTTGLILLSGPASGTPASGTPASGTLGARLAAICPSAADAVMQMLAWAPESRPSAAQMLRHPFFSVGGYSAQRALEAKPACEGPFDFSSYVHKTLEAVRLATLTALHESSASHERSASHPMDSVHMRALAHQVFSCLVNSTDNLKKFGAT